MENFGFYLAHKRDSALSGSWRKKTLCNESHSHPLESAFLEKLHIWDHISEDKRQKGTKISERLGAKPQDISNVYYICDKREFLVAINCVHFYSKGSMLKWNILEIPWEGQRLARHNIFSVSFHALTLHKKARGEIRTHEKHL